MFKVTTVEGDIASGLPDQASAMRAMRSAVDDEVSHHVHCHHGMIMSSSAVGLSVAFYTGPCAEDKSPAIIMSSDD